MDRMLKSPWWLGSRESACIAGAQFCLTLCNPMDCSMPGFPAPHRSLLEFAQVHVHCIGDVIPPSHPLSPSSPAFSLSQDQGHF